MDLLFVVIWPSKSRFSECGGVVGSMRLVLLGRTFRSPIHTRPFVRPFILSARKQEFDRNNSHKLEVMSLHGRCELQQRMWSPRTSHSRKRGSIVHPVFFSRNNRCHVSRHVSNLSALVWPRRQTRGCCRGNKSVSSSLLSLFPFPHFLVAWIDVH